MDKFLQQLHNEIEKLKREQKTIEAKIRALQAARNTYIQEEGLASQPLISPEGESRADKIEKIIKQEGRPLHYKVIVKLLKERENYKFDAKDPSSATTATLTMNKKRFKRVGKGTYTLAKNSTTEKSLFDK